MKKTCLLFAFSTFLFLWIAWATNYSMEERAAYDYAFQYGITTMNSIDDANMEWNLIRIEMAKMISNYAINTLWLIPDTSKNCYFPDVPSNLDGQYYNWVTKACQLGVMWVWITNFRPYDKVTRAQFGTVLSRVLNAKDTIRLSQMNNVTPYYSEHLKYLQEEWIMKNISNPSNLERRWWVMLMLMRAGNRYNDSDQTWPIVTLSGTDWMWITGLDNDKPIAVEEIELNTSRLYIKSWNLYTGIEVTIYPSDATDKTVIWDSSNTAVATVRSGVVYAKKLGDTVITATTSNNKKAQVRVTVTSIDISINSKGFAINDIGSKVNYGNNNDIGIDEKYLGPSEEYAACVKQLNKYDSNNANEYLDIQEWESNYNYVNNGKTRVHFINVGRWDATLLEHNGHYGLIDVGSKDTSTTYLSNVLAGKKLDFVLITHEHEDHLGNILEVVNNYVYQGTKFYFVKFANLQGSTKSSRTYYCHAFTAMRNRIGNDNNLVYLVNYQDDIILGDSSFKIKVLGNDISQEGYHVDESYKDENGIDRGKLDSENSNSVWVLVKYNNKTMLLTADMGEWDEYRVASSLSNLKIKWINVYKMGHHGATTAGYTPLIDFIKPKNVIVSNGKDYIRPYGNINLSAMCYMQYQYKSKLYLTDRVANGAVVYDFDDDAMYLWDGVRAIKNATANKFPLNLCRYNEENGVKIIDYTNNTTVMGHKDIEYAGKKCNLYLEYGNFIVGIRDGILYEEVGADKANMFRAPGRICE